MPPDTAPSYAALRSDRVGKHSRPARGIHRMPLPRWAGRRTGCGAAPCNARCHAQGRQGASTQPVHLRAREGSSSYFEEVFLSLTNQGLTAPIVAQRGVEHMRAPAAIDLKIGLRHAFVFEA